MEESLFRQMGGTYRQVGGYLLPNLELPEEQSVEIGVWGQRHRRYLKEHCKSTYIGYLFREPQTVSQLNYFVGQVYNNGGYFVGSTVKVQLLINGVWTDVEFEAAD